MIRSNKANITLEAAVIMPLVITVCFCVVHLLHYFSIELKVRNVVQSATRQFAVMFYPIDIAYATQATNPKNEKILSAIQQFKEVEQMIPFLNMLLNKTKQNNYKKLFKAYVYHHAKKQKLPLKHIQLEKVILPDIQLKNETYVGFKISYHYSVQIPFINISFDMKKESIERAWIGNRAPALLAHHKPVSIIKIVPPIVKRGSNARIYVKVPPNSRASIKILYKSGFSIAKGLQTKLALSDGQIEWNWKIGGNTTPGNWMISVTSDGFSDQKLFQVTK